MTTVFIGVIAGAIFSICLDLISIKLMLKRIAVALERIAGTKP